MRVLISGLCGFMGREVAKLCKAGYRGSELAAGVDPFGDEAEVPCAKSFDEAETGVDVIVDFSNHACTRELLAFALKNRLPLVLATTGQTEEELAEIRRAAEQIPIFFAANFSVGVTLLVELAKKAAAAMPDAEIEIVEAHHDRKLDAPSGTALTLAEAIREVRPRASFLTGRSGHGKRAPEEIGIHAVRMGNIVGRHEVILGTQNEIVTLKHEAQSRAVFAEGALAAAEFLIGKPAGFYDMKSLVAF